MSTFIHGGSGLSLDIGAKAHGPLALGDVVAVNPVTTTAGDEGYVTMAVGNLNTAIQQITMYGVVLGSGVKDRFAAGEDILLRIVGMVDVKVNNGTGAGEVLRLLAGNNHLMNAAAGTGISATYTVTTRYIGVAHAPNTGGAPAVARAYINGLGVWG